MNTVSSLTRHIGRLGLLGLFLGGAVPLAAPPAHAQDGADDVDSAIDPRAVAELKKMTALLDATPRMVIKVRSTWESIQESGLKLQFEARQEIGINRPNRLYGATVNDDGSSRKLWYDGSTLTHLNVGDKSYAQVPVPDTTNEMLDFLLQNYDLPAPPMLDFLYSDSGTSFLADVRAAVYVGECTRNGQRCHHLAFSKPNVDYQIWIPSEGRPLPSKYSITWTDDPNLPWFTATFLEWNTNPTFSLDSFSAKLPAGAKRHEVSRKTDAGEE